jgi:hypothetical protein
MIVYIAAPPFAYTLALQRFRTSPSDVLAAGMSVAYTAWIVVGLFTYIDHLAPDAKATLLDVIRVVTRKG